LEVQVVFVRKRDDYLSGEDEIRGPLPLTLAVVAIIGWGMAAYLASQFLHAQRADLLRFDNLEIQGCSAPL
jgi:hypothetical protein